MSPTKFSNDRLKEHFPFLRRKFLMTFFGHRPYFVRVFPVSSATFFYSVRTLCHESSNTTSRNIGGPSPSPPVLRPCARSRKERCDSTLSRGVQYEHCMTHKCIVVKIGETK